MWKEMRGRFLFLSGMEENNKQFSEPLHRFPRKWPHGHTPRNKAFGLKKELYKSLDMHFVLQHKL